MPEADGAKTKSARNAPGGGNSPSPPAGNTAHILPGSLPWATKHKKVLLYGAGIVLAVFTLLAPTLFYRLPTTQLNVNGHQLSLEVASTDAARQRGLSGRGSLAANKGMLFVFDKAGRECFWMKDMHFALDMVFIGPDKRVVQIQPDVSPQTYPRDFCAVNTRYVIELNAGQAARLGLRTGETLPL